MSNPSLKELQRYFFMLNKYLLFVFFPLTILSCRKPPDYSETPEITFKSISKQLIYDTDNLAYVDSVSITISFKDGDGDLGLSTDDIEGSDIYVDEFIFNYFIDIYKKENDTWVFVDIESIGGAPFHSRFERLLPEGASPIDGDLNYGLTLNTSSLLKPSDSIRFEIDIVDRELNRSNKVTTDAILFGTP